MPPPGSVMPARSFADRQDLDLRARRIRRGLSGAPTISLRSRTRPYVSRDQQSLKLVVVVARVVVREHEPNDEVVVRLGKVAEALADDAVEARANSALLIVPVLAVSNERKLFVSILRRWLRRRPTRRPCMPWRAA